MQYGKRLIIFCFVLFFSVQLFAQSPAYADITGLWKGTMYNDTTQLNYRYEIAISENKGKLSGYSHTYFILNDKEYHGVKKIKIRREGNEVITQDVELIANNYPIKPPKGVHVINVLRFEIKENKMILSGKFETNRTKEYAPATGFVRVERKNNFWQSALVPHLEELGLAKNLSFVEEAKKIEIQTASNTNTIADIVKIEPVKEKVTEPVKIKQSTVTDAAADIGNRKIETIQSVYYKTDSLELTLYDNGEVDGDTVSVLMNGELIMPRVGLSTNAVRKKISTVNTGDSIQLIMYAENLGSLPPNTGLLIVYDGPDRYEIRFSGDMKKNAAIIFRRKKN